MSSGLFPTKEPTGVWWKDHSLGLILSTLLVLQTVFAIWSGEYNYVRQNPFQLQRPTWVSSEFWWWWSWQYNVSLVADTFGVWLVVYLTKVTRERGSAESN